jgi:hypothetical protein
VGVNRILLAGGETYVGARVPTNTAEIFDAESEQYYALENMDQARETPVGLVFANGVALVSGGGQTVTGDDDFPTKALKKTELFDPADGALGAFRNVDLPLTFPRARGVGLDVLGQPTVLFGEGRHGWVGAGAEARVPLTTLEVWVP